MSASNQIKSNQIKSWFDLIWNFKPNQPETRPNPLPPAMIPNGCCRLAVGFMFKERTSPGRLICSPSTVLSTLWISTCADFAFLAAIHANTSPREQTPPKTQIPAPSQPPHRLPGPIPAMQFWFDLCIKSNQNRRSARMGSNQIKSNQGGSDVGFKSNQIKSNHDLI